MRLSTFDSPRASQGSYTAMAFGRGGPEEVERYETLEAGIMDILEMWPEDDCDVRILDADFRCVVHMARGTDPSACHVYHLNHHIGSYRCEYVHDEHGRVRTWIDDI